MSKDTHVIRGHSEREVELKVLTFINQRHHIDDEDWRAEDIVKTPARLLNYKPFSCNLYRVLDDV